MYKFIFILLSSVFLLSCVREEFHMDPELPDSESGMVLMSLHIPQPAFPSSARIQTPAEVAVEEISVIVLENGGYHSTVRGIQIENNGSNVTFKARIPSNPHPLKFLFIANANTLVQDAGFVVGETEIRIKEKLQAVFTEEGYSTPIIMYGEKELPQGIDTSSVNTLTGIVMTRSIARVDIDASQVGSEFELTSIKAYRINNLIQVIPNHITSENKVTEPSVPAASTKAVNSPEYSVPVEAGNISSSQLYISESAVVESDNYITTSTCVVIGGLYKGRQTYYRVDFESGGEIGRILRNHRYIFTITKVKSEGWDTPDDAANNASTNIDVIISEWDDNTSYIEFDANNYFGISSRVATLQYNQGSRKDILIETNVEDFTLQWCDSEGNGEGNGVSAGNTLSNDRFKARINSEGTNLRIEALQQNDTEEIITSYILVKAKRLRIIITIHQLPKSQSPQATRNIVVFGPNRQLGRLGDELFGSTNEIERAKSLRSIIKNSNYYGPEGTFVCGGYYIGGTPNDNFQYAAIQGFDVIYMTYAIEPNEQTVQAIEKWRSESQNHVLIIHHDNSSTNSRLMSLYEVSRYRGSQSGEFTVSAQAPAFILDGIFGTVTPGYKFRIYDDTYGLIDPAAHPEIQPILIANNGHILLGVDTGRRIVYCGDIDIYFNDGGNLSNRPTGNGIISNDADRILANLWAWIGQTVLDQNS